MKKSEVLYRFREYLTERGFGPGDKLPGELELAEAFGISRGDIREVLMHFSHLGLLKRIKKRGTFIQEVPYGHIQDDLAFCFQLADLPADDLLEARIAMELAIAPLLIKRINRETLERLRKNVTDMENAAEKPETADLLDRDFHLELFTLSGNSVLKILSGMLYTIFRKDYRTRFQTPRWVLRSASNHRQLLDAIEAGDEEKLRELIRIHLMPPTDPVL